MQELALFHTLMASSDNTSQTDTQPQFTQKQAGTQKRQISGHVLISSYLGRKSECGQSAVSGSLDCWSSLVGLMNVALWVTEGAIVSLLFILKFCPDALNIPPTHTHTHPTLIFHVQSILGG